METKEIKIPVLKEKALEVLEFLKAQTEPLTGKEIAIQMGRAAEGDKSPHMKVQTHLGQLIKHEVLDKVTVKREAVDKDGNTVTRDYSAYQFNGNDPKEVVAE